MINNEKKQTRIKMPSMNYSTKKILVLGGYGFIGSNIVRHFLKKGSKLIVVDNLESKAGGNLHNLESIKNDITIFRSSVLNFDSLCDYIANIDIVINCAASTSHSRSMNEPFFDLDVNLKGMLNILEAMKRFNPKARLIHFGTTTQFGRLKTLPANEDHPEFPTDIYSANKCLSEKYALLYNRSFGINATVLRISNTYGPYASIHSPEFTFNNYFLGQALQDKQINIYGDGSQMRNFLYIDDLLDAVDKSLENSESIGKTLLVTSDNHYSISDISELIISLCQTGSNSFVPWPIDKKDSEVGDQIFDNSQAKNLLKWEASTSLKVGLTKTIEFYMKFKTFYL